jgi:hypothetical protein
VPASAGAFSALAEIEGAVLAVSVALALGADLGALPRRPQPDQATPKKMLTAIAARISPSAPAQ